MLIAGCWRIIHAAVKEWGAGGRISVAAIFFRIMFFSVRMFVLFFVLVGD